MPAKTKTTKSLSKSRIASFGKRLKPARKPKLIMLGVLVALLVAAGVLYVRFSHAASGYIAAATCNGNWQVIPGSSATQPAAQFTPTSSGMGWNYRGNIVLVVRGTDNGIYYTRINPVTLTINGTVPSTPWTAVPGNGGTVARPALSLQASKFDYISILGGNNSSAFDNFATENVWSGWKPDGGTWTGGIAQWNNNVYDQRYVGDATGNYNWYFDVSNDIPATGAAKNLIMYNCSRKIIK